MSARARRSLFQLLGVLMVALIGGFFALTIAIYMKVFSPAVWVGLDVTNIGTQLQTGALVKARGVEVGEVSEIEPLPHGAHMQLRLDPDRVADIPRTVKATLLPETLFGNRYVNLEIPKNADVPPLRDGDTVQQDRSKPILAVQQVLDDLEPVLKAVQPEKLASTLSAVATALRGQGNRLGQSLVNLGNYLAKMNPELPQLHTDIQRLAQVADQYNAAMPDLVKTLTNFSTTSRTLVQKMTGLGDLYGKLTAASTDLDAFLRVNRANLIDLAASSKPTLEVLERYAPEYPCLFRQFADQVATENKVFGLGSDRPHTVHLTIQVTASRGEYRPGVDTPKYLDDRGPRCYQNTGPPGWKFPQYPPDGGPLKDGTTHPPAPDDESPTAVQDFGTGSSGSGSGTASGSSGDQSSQTSTSSQSGTTPQGANVPQSVANSAPETRVVRTLLAPQLNVPVRKVPGWADLLVGPLYRGSEVTLK